MRRADPQELREDARPAVLLSLSEPRLRDLFPISFSAIEDGIEPEPSIGALVRLDSRQYLVVTYGTVTHRATLAFPLSANVHDAIEDLRREVPISDSEILWTADAALPRRAGAR
ncbi:MAG TPA: hypothetical protein VM733_20660 [Thermoanaerobaculia bacterium]|nr:hypothetical protein [Thermoanaerobaculia bacterium]